MLKSYVLKNIFFQIILIAGVFTISSCCKANISFKEVIKNETNHLIELKRFRNGIEVSSMSLAASSKVETGIIRDVTEDSMIVVYDKIVRAVHYSSALKTPGTNLKAIKASDPRSFYNSKSYQVVREGDLNRCGSSSTISTFTFVEQDYLNASK